MEEVLVKLLHKSIVIGICDLLVITIADCYH